VVFVGFRPFTIVYVGFRPFTLVYVRFAPIGKWTQLMPNTRGNERYTPQVLRIHSQSRCQIFLVPSPPPFLNFYVFLNFLSKNAQRCANRGLKSRFSKTRFDCKFSILAPPNPSKSANGSRIRDILQFQATLTTFDGLFFLAVSSVFSKRRLTRNAQRVANFPLAPPFPTPYSKTPLRRLLPVTLRKR